MIFLILRLILFNINQESYAEGQKIKFNTRLTEEPQIIYGHQQFRVKNGNGERITIITGLSPIYQYGDRIKIEGVISQNNYKGHIFNKIKSPALQIDHTEQNFITSAATYVRRKATKLFQDNLPTASAGLLNGIIFGGNQNMPQNFLLQLRSVGVIHVIAASGMNVTFVASALIAILGVIFKRQIALTIAIFGIVFYAFLAGFEPSIVRAAIMSILAFSASLLGRQNFALASVFLTGYIMLLLSPFLVTDIGFQLSFLATLGILVIKPLFPTPKNFSLLDDVWTTVAAQIATLPILLSIFGQYGLLSILVNALILWTVPVLMILGSLGVILGIVFEPLGKVFLFLCEPILFFFEKIVAYFANFGWTLTIPAVSAAVWIGYYLLLAGLIVFIRAKKSKTEAKSKNPS